MPTWAKGAAAARVAGRVSLVISLQGLSRRDLRRWQAAAKAGDDIELVLVGPRKDASTPSPGPGMAIVTTRSSGRSLSARAGILASTGERVVLVGPGAQLDAPSLAQLAAELDDPAVAVVQPVEEHPDTTVCSAGAYFAPGTPVPAPLLAGHASEDAKALSAVPLPAIHSTVLAMRAADLIALRGLDARFDQGFAEVDLSRRAVAAGLGEARLVPDARAVVSSAATDPSRRVEAGRVLAKRWPHPPPGSAQCVAAAGFTIVGHDQSAAGGSVPRLARLRRPGDGTALRWTIDTAATAGWWGDAWGDTHFANSLAAALRRLGQHVAVDRRSARGRESRRLDDVVLVLRGRDRVEPVEGPANLLWVISHPDEVTAEEAAGFDAVFAASQAWAAQQSQAWGVPIEPLLQCVDATTFRPVGIEPDGGEPTALRPTPPGRVVFVGNARRGFRRPVVEAALQTDHPIVLYGTGWEDLGAADRVAASQIANDRVGELYATAQVVLNDHWEDMARHGFISNRLFDAVACGARVLSDPVAGADELFDGCVRFASSPSEVASLLEQPGPAWPDTAHRLAVAERIRREHSFDERAGRLLEHVLGSGILSK